MLPFPISLTLHDLDFVIFSNCEPFLHMERKLTFSCLGLSVVRLFLRDCLRAQSPPYYSLSEISTFSVALHAIDVKVCVHLTPKWPPINFSFVCMFISPLPHFHFKILLFLYILTRQRGLINMQTKE